MRSMRDSHSRRACEVREKNGLFSSEIILTRGTCYCLLQALASHLVVNAVFSNSKAVLSNVSPCIN